MWCENHMTFRDAPKNSSSDIVNKDLLKTLQPNPPFDPTTITTEPIDNLLVLPSNAAACGTNGATYDTADQQCCDVNGVFSVVLASETCSDQASTTSEPATSSSSTTSEPASSTSAPESTAETTTLPAATSNPVDGSITLFDSNNVIRPFGSDQDLCIYKRFTGFTSGHDIWLWPCDPTHKSKKYQWSFIPVGDGTAGLIKSTGSDRKAGRTPFCWTFFKPDTIWGQRIKITECNAADTMQHFQYNEGRIHSDALPNMCVGYDVEKYHENIDRGTNGIAITIMQCVSVTWGQYVGST
jgi:hypothetical protein